MTWNFTEEQLMFQRSCRDFAVKELRPLWKQHANEDWLPKEGLKKMGEAGLLGIRTPEKYGGQAGDFVSLGIVAEEISREYFEFGTLAVIGPVCWELVQNAPQETQEEVMPKLTKGDAWGSLCMTEPDVGSDAAHIRTRGIKDGDCYIVNGEKTSITAGSYANYGLTSVVTDPSKEARGITTFIIPFNLPGISQSLIKHLGAKGFGCGSITFDNVRVPARYRCGEEGTGFIGLAGMIDWLRVCLSLNCVGVAAISLEETAEYVKQRQAFGRPIGKFEAVSHKIVDRFAQVEACRLLCYRALSLVEESRKDPGKRGEASVECSMAKYLSPRVTFDTVKDCILLHGHLGYSEDYPLGKRMLDCLAWQIGDGTREIQEIVMVSGLIGRDMVAYR